jgi:hypothetical protein
MAISGLGVQGWGLKGFLINVVIFLVLRWLLGMFVGFTDKFTTCLFGLSVGAYLDILLAIFIFLPQLWGILRLMYDKTIGAIRNTKQGIESAAKGDWRITYGVIGIIISILRIIPGNPVLRLESNACGSACVWCYSGVVVISILLLVWGIRSKKRKSDLEGISNFALIGKKRRENIRLTEEFVARRIENFSDMSTLIFEFTELIKEMQAHKEAEAKGKRREVPYTETDLEAAYMAKRTELVNKLIRRGRLTGDVYRKARENLRTTMQDEQDIDRELAKMSVGAFIEYIKGGIGGRKGLFFKRKIYFRDDFEDLDEGWIKEEQESGR